MLQNLIAAKLANYHASGLDLPNAARKAILEIPRMDEPCAVLAINNEGTIALESTARLFYTASGSSGHPSWPLICPTTVPILPQHIIHQGPRIIAGLSRYATTPGHTLATIQGGQELFSLSSDIFLTNMQTVACIAGTLRTFYMVARCALATDGGGISSIIPLHGLDAV